MTIEELLAATGLTANDLVPIYDAEAAQSVEPTQKVTATQLAAAVKVLASLVNTTEMNAAIQQSTASDWGNLNSYLSSLESGANTLITYAGKMRTITFQGVARSHAEDETLMTLPQEHRPLIQGNNYFEGNIGGTSVVIAINGSTGKVSIFTINGATSLARVYFSATYMAQ